MKRKNKPDKQKAEVQVCDLPGAVFAAVSTMTKKLQNGELKPTMAEFSRLLDLQQGMIADEVRHIKVTWVDSLNGTESTSEI